MLMGVGTEMVVAHVGSARHDGRSDESGRVLAVLPRVGFSRSTSVERVLLVSK